MDERITMEMIDFEGMRCPSSYIGDNVYAVYDGNGIWLHTASPYNPCQKVYLEPEVLRALVRFAESIRTRVLEPTEGQGEGE